MNPDKIVFLLNDSVRAIRAQYEPDELREHTAEWFKTMDPEIAVGDILVVPTRSRTGFTTVKVTEVDAEIDYTSSGEVRWVAGRVDMAAFGELIDNEREAVKAVQNAERNRKREELRAQMIKDNESVIAKLALTNHGAPQVTEDDNGKSSVDPTVFNHPEL